MDTAYHSAFTRRPLAHPSPATAMPSDSRAAHHPHHPHPYAHPAHPSYQSPVPSYHAHHPPARHVSNGHPSQVVVPGPPPPSSVPTNGPPPAEPPVTAVVTPSTASARVARSLPPMSAEARAARERMDSILAQLANGAVAEGMNDQDRAESAFHNALRHNPSSILGLNAVASVARSRDEFDKAIEYFQRILNANPENGEIWGSMGHCLLMKDDLPKAYTAYQQALYHLSNPKASIPSEPKLWYGIGILYDRYGSFEHAEEAFSSVLKADPRFDKANEIYFRLGIIYKHQRKFKDSLDCFRYILNNPPRPLTSWDIWFQLGHVYEQDRDFESAKDAYMRVLRHQPDHAKVLQQLGWIYHQPGASFTDQDQAVSFLTKSLETDPNDAQSWYLLGRAYMAAARYNKAYEAYQQAVYRDGRNPTYWCSIGVLYYQIQQYRDALDAYSRAIRLNAYMAEVWYNLGSLYESCNNQMNDALDAYSRAYELDPANTPVKERIRLLQNPNAGPLPPPPTPVDVHPSQYPSMGSEGPGSPNGSPPRFMHLEGMSSRDGGRDLPPPPPGAEARAHSPGPFRNGAAPPPLQHVDESRGSMAGIAPLARMEVDPRAEAREERPNGSAGGRYDPLGRQPESPISPRAASSRRDVPPPFPPARGFNYPPGYDRSREEWEQRADSRGPPGPSPRMADRAPDGRERMHQEYAGYQQGYYDARGYPQAPPSAGGRYDPRREADELQAREDELQQPPARANGRRTSIAKEDLTRGTSPVPSATGGAKGRKRGEGKKTKEKEDKPASTKGRKGKAANLKAGEEANGQSPRTTVHTSSPTISVGTTPGSNAPKAMPPVQAPPQPLLSSMARTVDEDYDEGAADALISLAGGSTTNLPFPTRHISPSPSFAARHQPFPQHPPSLSASNKRAFDSQPFSPDQSNKRAKGDKVQSHSPPASATGSIGSRSGATSVPPAKKMVIEVLNAPSVASPLPRAASAVDEKESARTAPPSRPSSGGAQQERGKEEVQGTEDKMDVDAPAPVAEVTPAPSAPQSASPPAPTSAPSAQGPSPAARASPTPPAAQPSPKPPTPAASEPEKEKSWPSTPPVPQPNGAPVEEVKEKTATPPSAAPEKGVQKEDVVMGESEAYKGGDGEVKE
ncbi:general transcriptional repressor [Cryptococcus wingfieldii CBS 7118]|uniref:General transcriptional repressor n=1 Tax=Cryptococcus wingfieldii CBS 7118 TaxID=1295528 RepID=A0A1E3JM34_9TREE|nr:general transcriptional repressor [Cryptococcus wingfieldii CBS 7118]ODO01931.1 general transcriptional repressor [Cryptococcus wingfieldii CBS 7118]